MVFQTDIFSKLTLGAPDKILLLHPILLVDSHSSILPHNSTLFSDYCKKLFKLPNIFKFVKSQEVNSTG